MHHLSTLLLPSHVQQDELAQRFRNEKYALRMSRSGFGLLVGWLTEGVGGEAAGAGEGFSGEKGKRGRASVMRVVNNHLRFDGNYANFRTAVSLLYLHNKCSDIFEHHLNINACLGGIYRFAVVADAAKQCSWRETDEDSRSSRVQCIEGRA